jgi:hypothetical protein
MKYGLIFPVKGAEHLVNCLDWIRICPLYLRYLLIRSFVFSSLFRLVRFVRCSFAMRFIDFENSGWYFLTTLTFDKRSSMG